MTNPKLDRTAIAATKAAILPALIKAKRPPLATRLRDKLTPTPKKDTTP